MSREYSDKKKAYAARLHDLLTENSSVLVANADHVGSKQLQDIRAALRGKATILMGKNTQIRRVIREAAKDFPELQKLIPLVRQNVSLIFTNEDIKTIRDLVESYKVPAAAKAGVIAPIDVWVPAGPTGMDPGQTAFFQALGIATKIARGSIEIVSPVHLIKTGDKVGSSEVTLLAKLNIRPFSYGLVVSKVYDCGYVYESWVMDITQEELLKKFFSGVSTLACLSLGSGFPTAAAFPHYFAGAYKKLLAVAIAADFIFEEAKEVKAMLDNPEAFAAAAPAASAAPAAAEATKAEEPESEEESDEDMGGGLFGDESD